MKEFKLLGQINKTNTVLLCSFSLFLSKPHNEIAKELKKIIEKVYIVCPSDVLFIEFQDEELKIIMNDAYVLEKSGLNDNYDQIRIKLKENDIITLGHGIAELRTLGSNRIVKEKLTLDNNGKVKKLTDTTDGAKICDMTGFINKCYDMYGNVYDIDESTKYGSEYLVYKHKCYAVKFFQRELTEGFKRKLDVLVALKKEDSPFVRALPVLFLYKSESFIDSNICGYLMMKFDKPISFIGDYTNSRFNDNVEDRFKNDILSRMKILASLADCFVFYHSRDILLSDIKTDNFFVDPSDFTVFPIDSDGFSCHGENSEYPRPEHSNLPVTTDLEQIKNYRQSLDTELYCLTALIFFMLTTRYFNDYKEILSNNKKTKFPKNWSSFPEYIREQFFNAAKGIYTNAYGWKRIFDRYIGELSGTDSSEYMRIEIIRLKAEKENDIIKINSLDTECRQAKNELETTKKENKEKDATIKSYRVRTEKLHTQKNGLVVAVIILSILLILVAGLLSYVYFEVDNGMAQLSFSGYKTNAVYLYDSEHENKIIKYGGNEL